MAVYVGVSLQLATLSHCSYSCDRWSASLYPSACRCRTRWTRQWACCRKVPYMIHRKGASLLCLCCAGSGGKDVDKNTEIPDSPNRHVKFWALQALGGRATTRFTPTTSRFGEFRNFRVCSEFLPSHLQHADAIRRSLRQGATSERGRRVEVVCRTSAEQLWIFSRTWDAPQLRIELGKEKAWAASTSDRVGLATHSSGRDP